MSHISTTEDEKKEQQKLSFHLWNHHLKSKAIYEFISNLLCK